MRHPLMIFLTGANTGRGHSRVEMILECMSPRRAVVRALAGDLGNVPIALLTQGTATLREGAKGGTPGGVRSKGNAGGGSAMGLGIFILSC